MWTRNAMEYHAKICLSTGKWASLKFKKDFLRLHAPLYFVTDLIFNYIPALAHFCLICCPEHDYLLICYFSSKKYYWVHSYCYVVIHIRPVAL